MAATAVPIDSADEAVLARQAEAFDRRAERLRAEARDLTQQAIELRLQVERQRRAPLRRVHPRVGVAPERDAQLLSRLADLLAQIGPCASSVLAEHANVSQSRVYQGLVALEKSGAVKRSGIRRGTIWGLVDDEDLDGHAPIASARTLVLDAGRKLDTFDIDTIDAELPMLTTSRIRSELRQLVADGVFSEVKDGVRKIYAFERPTGGPTSRPKHELPEAKVVEFARKTPLRQRGSVVSGTGKRQRSASAIVNELLRELADWPIVEITKHAHSYRFKIDGKTISSCSLTPGGTALGETRRRLRNAGIDVKP